MIENPSITVQEYVALAKADLDKFQKTWETGMKNSPDMYPEKLPKNEWREQEMAARSGW